MAQMNHAVAGPRLVTHEGAPARQISAEASLRRSIMACMLWEDEFYESGVAVAERIRLLAGIVDPQIVAALAIEARENMKLRHAPLWLLRALASGTPLARLFVASALTRVIQRPDEITEFLALYWKDGRTPIAASVKKGLAGAFRKFNGYQLAKYNRDSAIKLRDALFLVHAKPVDKEQGALWKALIDGTLSAPDTWEVALSSGSDKRETWIRLMAEGKLGGLALLRNLRNMLKAGVGEPLISLGLETMRTERILPFRFLAAAPHAPGLETALETAMFRCLQGSQKLVGRTIIVVDHSQSMDARISAKSDLTRHDAAAALAILLREVCEDVRVVVFGQIALQVPSRRGFALRDTIRHSNVGGSTDTAAAKAMADRMGYDRLIIVTDEQSHTALTDPMGRGYVINVASAQNGIGYGPWVHIDGWSEAVVDYIRLSESEPFEVEA